jgi:ferredoxin-NADP reductase
MSSSPEVDDELTVTVKRVPGGVVSNWMNDVLRAGGEVEMTPPAGVFCLGPDDGELVAYCGGSGITPVISKTALATTGRRVRLLYANRDRDAVIFADEIDALCEQNGDRLEVVHHLDVDRGFVDVEMVRDFLGGVHDGEHYICGPTPFMDVVESALHAGGVPAERIHIERFTPGEAAPPVAANDAPTAAAPAVVTIELEGRTATTEHRPGTTILQTARQLGMSPPFSCESGSCASCMARLVDGEVTMFVNNVLTDDEVDDGWVLTCQSVPVTPSVRVVYE